MASDDFMQAEMCLPRLQARDYLLSLSAASYPHAKKQWQEKHHREAYMQAHPREEQAPVLSMHEFARALRSGGSHG